MGYKKFRMLHVVSGDPVPDPSLHGAVQELWHEDIGRLVCEGTSRWVPYAGPNTAAWGGTLPITRTGANQFTCTDTASSQETFKVGRFLTVRSSGGTGNFDIAQRVTAIAGAAGTLTVDTDGPAIAVGDVEAIYWATDAAPIVHEPLRANLAANNPAANYPAGWLLTVGDLPHMTEARCEDVGGGAKAWLDQRKFQIIWYTNYTTAAASRTGAYSWDSDLGADGASHNIYTGDWTTRIADPVTGGAHYWSFVLDVGGVTLASWDDSTEIAGWITKIVLLRAIQAVNLADGQLPFQITTAPVGTPPAFNHQSAVWFRMVVE